MFDYSLSSQTQADLSDSRKQAFHNEYLPSVQNVFNLGNLLTEDPERFRNPLIIAQLSEREKTIHLTMTGETENFQQMLRRREENENRSWSVGSFYQELTSKTGTVLLNPGVSCYPLYEFEGKLFLIVVGREHDGALTLPGGYYDHSPYQLEKKDDSYPLNSACLIRSALGELTQEIVPLDSSMRVLSPLVRLPCYISDSLQDCTRLAKSGDVVIEDNQSLILRLQHPYPFLSQTILEHTTGEDLAHNQDNYWSIELADFEPALPNLMRGYRVTINGESVPLLRVSLFAPWKSIQFILPVNVRLPSGSCRLIHGEDYLDSEHEELRTKLFLDKLRLLQLGESSTSQREEAPLLPILYESVVTGIRQLRSEEFILSESFLGDSMRSWLFQAPGLIGAPTAHAAKQKGMTVSYQSYRNAFEIRRILERTCVWRRPHSIEKNFPHRFEDGKT